MDLWQPGYPLRHSLLTFQLSEIKSIKINKNKKKYNDDYKKAITSFDNKKMA